MLDDTIRDGLWYLEGGGESGGRPWRKDLLRLPMLVGRSVNAELRLGSNAVSGRHAEFFERDGVPWLRDLGSTNGTYVNFAPLRGEVALRNDDIVHFAGIEFRIGFRAEPRQSSIEGTVELARVRLATDLAVASGRFRELLETRGVTPYFQPIVHVQERSVLGVELLSRGEISGRFVEPAELFEIAAFVGRERELSELCRDRGAEVVQAGSLVRKLFVNAHPAELERGERLLESLSALSRVLTGSQVVVEIHEASVNDRGEVRELHAALRNIGIQLAFDDFGTGRSRLLEIADAPPDYLKFDGQWVRGLDVAGEGRRRLVGSLVRMTTEMGVVPIAEGVETEDELEACIDAGFPVRTGVLSR